MEGGAFLHPVQKPVFTVGIPVMRFQEIDGILVSTFGDGGVKLDILLMIGRAAGQYPDTQDKPSERCE